jgi:hypothetical protein
VKRSEAVFILSAYYVRVTGDRYVPNDWATHHVERLEELYSLIWDEETVAPLDPDPIA